MKKVLVTFVVAVVACLGMNAQSRGGLRINEVMVVNDSTSIIDDYGQYSAWIELFNSNFAPLEISSVYLTTVKDSMMYAVPLGDVNTRIPKRQHVIFWADGQPNKGTFHTNLILKSGEDNWIGIYDANKQTLIDEVVVPAALLPGQSYARKIDGVRDDANSAEAWEIRDGSDEKYITPSSANVIQDTNDRVEKFHENDENGFALTIMAMCIVFTALLLLCLSFLFINKIGARVSRANKMRAQGINHKDVPRSERPDTDSGEEIAAIVMALHEHLDAHDTEKTILTINKVKRAYSPWSSKIYSMREVPTRK